MMSLSAPPAALVADAIARIEKRRDALDRLAAQGMEMIERLAAGEAVEIPGRRPFESRVRAFAVISRAVRLCLALASRLDEALIALLRGGPIPEFAILAPDAPVAESAPEAPVAAPSPRARGADAETGDREAAVRPRAYDLDHLTEGETYEALLHRPWRVVVEAIRADLGLPPDGKMATDFEITSETGGEDEPSRHFQAQATPLNPPSPTARGGSLSP